MAPGSGGGGGVYPPLPLQGRGGGRGVSGAGRRQPQHALAVLVDLLGEVGDALAQLRGQAGVFVGEGEGFEAAGFDIHRIVADAQPGARRQRPVNVQLAGERTQVEGVI